MVIKNLNERNKFEVELNSITKLRINTLVTYNK